MGSQGGSCRFGLGSLARCRSQLCPQSHFAFCSNLLRRPASPLSFLTSRGLAVARLNHPEYQGLRRTKECQAFVPSMPLSPIIRARVLSIFRAVQYFPLAQLQSTTISNAIEFIASFLFMSGDSCRLEMPSQVYKIACNSPSSCSLHRITHLHHIRDPNTPISFHSVSTSFKENFQLSFEHLES